MPARKRLVACSVLCAALAAGCASTPPEHGAWRADDIAAAGIPLVSLHAGHQASGAVSREQVRELLAILRKLEAVTRTPAAELFIATGESPNAFLSGEPQAPIVVVNLAMLRLIEGDADAAAALLGHELAHLAASHRKLREARARELDDAAGLAGALLMIAGIPFGSLAADAGALVMERRGSREDEIGADALGVDYARMAGFDPAGAVRLQQKLAASDPGGIGFLRTHPQSDERIEALQKLVPMSAR